MTNNQQSAEEVADSIGVRWGKALGPIRRLFIEAITADRLATEQRVRDRECVWKEAGLNAYNTACGFSYRLFDKPAHENYDHCPKCAGKINCGGRIREASDER